MLPPTLNDQLLAELRAATARLLVNRRLSQAKVAEALGVSQAMVSKYLARPAPTELPEPTASDVEAAARTLAEALEEQVELAEAQLSVELTLRDPHGREQTVAFKVRLTPPDDPRGQVLANLQQAARKAAELELRAVRPQVHINLAQTLPGAASPQEVAAFPGRFVPLPGKTHPAAPPAFGASGHLAGLLLKLLPLQPELRAICNLRYSTLVAAALEALGWQPVRLRFTGEELEVPAATPVGDVLVDEGGFGREPALYLLGPDGTGVMARVGELLEAVKAEQQRMARIEVKV